jgi:hypothetical protein
MSGLDRLIRLEARKATAMRKALLVFLISLFSLPTTACDMGLAFGDPNAVIVVAPEEWWPPLRDSVFAVLSPDVFTLRAERTFRVTYQPPIGAEWQRLKRFKEEVLIGTPEDPWIAEALATLHDTVTFEIPGLVETEEVWAKYQKVTMLLVDPEGDIPAQVFSMVDEVHSILDQRFREGALRRMFVSGSRMELADSLLETAGFSLLLPEVYRWNAQDSLYIFRNDNPDPSELIRQFGITWRTPIPTGLTADSLMDWKEAVSQESYAYPQAVQRENLHTRNLAMGDMTITEFRGAWSNPPGSTWPAAGPFIFWSVTCPAQNRLYFIDAWLYAPEKDKWEYLLQLETILGSFRCGSQAGERTSMGD